MASIVIAVAVYLGVTGYDYYATPLSERFYHPQHEWLKPSGKFGQGLGVVGTFIIFFGVFIYILHKRYNILGKRIRLKYLLEFHIFLCSLGPVLIVYHTAFKFGGIVAIAFWSMIAVVLSGVLGRYIYLQIPRTIEGRALSMQEVKNSQIDIQEELRTNYGLKDVDLNIFAEFTDGDSSNGSSLGRVRKFLKQHSIQSKEQRTIVRMVKKERTLLRRIRRLERMKRLFRYWHVAHMPFAIIMLVIVVIHVIIAFTFGYRWIF